MKHKNRSFILLEVIVSLVILAVSMTAILRGFAIALSTVRENRIIEVSAQLAQSLLDDYEIEPPVDGRDDGSFADDIRFGDEFEFYYWERDVEEDDVRYDDTPSKPLQDFEPLLDMELKIIYDNGKQRRFVPLVIKSRILEEQIYTQQSIALNQLF